MFATTSPDRMAAIRAACFRRGRTRTYINKAKGRNTISRIIISDNPISIIILNVISYNTIYKRKIYLTNIGVNEDLLGNGLQIKQIPSRLTAIFPVRLLVGVENKLHDLKLVLDTAQVYSQEQIDAIVELFFAGASREKLDPILDVCVATYLEQLDEDGQTASRARPRFSPVPMISSAPSCPTAAGTGRNSPSSSTC
jgi:hypothetical protein